MNVIEFDNVSVRYREQRIRGLKEMLVHGRGKSGWFHALHDVSLTIHHGEAVGIVGPNGAGKSTLLRVAAGIIPPSAGTAIDTQSPSGVPRTQSCTWSIAALAAEAALDAPRASMIAAPRF